MVHYDKVIKPYIVGIETSKLSLRNITEAIRDKVHKKNYLYCGYNSLFLYSMVTVSLFSSEYFNDKCNKKKTQTNCNIFIKLYI